jgi:hypothetical protein
MLRISQFLYSRFADGGEVVALHVGPAPPPPPHTGRFLIIIFVRG